MGLLQETNKELLEIQDGDLFIEAASQEPFPFLKKNKNKFPRRWRFFKHFKLDCVCNNLFLELVEKYNLYLNTCFLFAFVSQNLFTENSLLNTWREVFVVTLYFTERIFLSNVHQFVYQKYLFAACVVHSHVY